MGACPRWGALVSICWLACSSTYENAVNPLTAGAGGQQVGAAAGTTAGAGTSAPVALPPTAAGTSAGAGAAAGGSGSGGPAGAPPGGPLAGSAAGAAVPAAAGGAGGAGMTPAAGSGETSGALGRCTLPAGADPAATRELYAKWKTELLTADGAGGFLRVRRPNSGSQINSSNSEGIAYGMTLAVYMDDQPTFDALWQYALLHRGRNGLMEWEISPDGNVIGSGAASDGDEDMAFALVMADARWGGAGSLPDTYLNYAKSHIDLMWRFEVDHARGDVFMPGDQFPGAQVINISYFAPAYYRIFGEVSGRVEDWKRVVDSSYRVLEATLNAANENLETGLVPAWSTSEGVPMAPPGSGHPIHHQLDSCRTPFRIAQDYCWFGEPRALAYLQKINAFHARVGATKLLDGYNLDGSVFPGAMLHLAAFVAGAGVGAMATPEHAAVRDESYREIIAWGPLLGGSRYYNVSWSVLGALMMTGEFRDLRK